MTFRTSKLEPWQVEDVERLRKLVDGRITQAELARLGVVSSESHASQILTARRPIPIDMAPRLAGALHCTVDDFSPTLASRIRGMARHVRGGAGATWPFSASPDEVLSLSPDQIAQINAYIEERILLSRSSRTP